MNNKSPEFAYALGYTAEEQGRLARQSELVAPCTERLFRAAGIGPGSRVLDVGSGIGMSAFCCVVSLAPRARSSVSSAIRVPLRVPR